MVDFNVFDSILDCAFVVDADGRVIYCNEPAATFSGVSMRRVVGKAKIQDLFALVEPGLLPFGPGSRGYADATPFIETDFTVTKSGQRGTCQLAVRPLDESHWIFFVRDVSLEAALHAKYRSELSQKEEYARNLEKLVEARTAELRRVNATLGAILDSLGQGFFTFDQTGACGTVFTKACESVLGSLPTGRTVVDVLGLNPHDVAQFKKWSETLFGEFLPFDDLRSLGPATFAGAGDRFVTLEYHPIRREDGSISDVVVVATDKTAEVEAQRLLEVERQYAAMVVKYTKNKDQFLRFVSTVRPTLDELVARTAREMGPNDVNEAFRALHTLEGEAGAFSLRDLRFDARECQQVIEPWRGGTRALDAATRRVLGEELEDARVRFDRFLSENADVIRPPAVGEGRAIEVSVNVVKHLLDDARTLPGGPALADRYAGELLREPIADHLRYFDGLMTAVAEKLGKRVNPLVIDGGDVRIDPELYESLFASMVHLFRNAMDHGLEAPSEREWMGKPAAGTVRAVVSGDADHLRITVTDDGRGIDPARIRARLREKFPTEDHDARTDHEIIQAVCRPGFSSRDEVGEFSGRGVGLDALREEVVRRGGTLVVNSKLNEGTAIEIALPWATESEVLLKGA